jgi:hypothetical protein
VRSGLFHISTPLIHTGQPSVKELAIPDQIVQFEAVGWVDVGRQLDGPLVPMLAVSTGQEPKFLQPVAVPLDRSQP